MARANRTYTLAGFSEQLDWRPLMFVEPVPPATVCNSCGYVPRSTCSLPCGHVLCEPCCRRCVTADGAEFECPFDGDLCAAEDVARRECSGNLMRREVRCWNNANGCAVILPASEVARHFHRDCQHHVTRCPTCLATVLWTNVCAHQKTRCANLVLHAAAEARPATDNQRQPSVATEKGVEQQAAKLDATLAQLYLESSSKSDRLVELCRSARDLNETLRGQFHEAAARNEHRLESNAALSRAAYMEKSDALMSAMVAMSRPVRDDPETHEWVLTNYMALKETAMTEGCSVGMSEKVYLRRYLMSWGIHFRKNMDTVRICLRHCLHKGRYDEFLDWPYAHEMKLVVIHPTTREERQIRIVPSAVNNAEAYCRPIALSNRPVFFPVDAFDPGDIERGGFVKNDQLLLRFEVLL